MDIIEDMIVSELGESTTQIVNPLYCFYFWGYYIHDHLGEVWIAMKTWWCESYGKAWLKGGIYCIYFHDWKNEEMIILMKYQEKRGNDGVRPGGIYVQIEVITCSFS